MKVLDYHYKKLKWYKQCLMSLYSLTDEHKNLFKERYREAVNKDRRAIREHIRYIKEVNKCIMMK